MADNRSFVWVFFFSSRRRHTRFDCDWSSDVCSSDLVVVGGADADRAQRPGGDSGQPARGGGRRSERLVQDSRAARGSGAARGSLRRSGERRVGEEGRSRGAAVPLKKKKMRRKRWL